jgi:ubiquinone/menaquinone biosynthesis C-methylase UbiE
MDWGVGRYESIAAQLAPAARAVVDTAAPQPGERLLDLGCGTGNAALYAAELGASVIGVDPAERLVEVARAEAQARGLPAEFVVGSAEAIPLPDDAVEATVSSFAVIFAADAAGAAEEMARVTRPGGRIVLSAWLPGGAMSKAAGIAREALAAALGDAAPPSESFPWHERKAVAEMLAPHGFRVSAQEHELAFTAASAEKLVDDELRDHPLWLAGRAVLEPRGEMERVRARAIAALEESSEDPEAFRARSRYVILSATRT